MTPGGSRGFPPCRSVSPEGARSPAHRNDSEECRDPALSPEGLGTGFERDSEAPHRVYPKAAANAWHEPAHVGSVTTRKQWESTRHS